VATLLSLGSAVLDAIAPRGAVQLATATQGRQFLPTIGRYDLAEAYYANAAYDAAGRPGVRAGRAGLSRAVRPVLSLAKPAVDWWPGHVYPGTWTRDGLRTSSGRPNRVPYDDDTPEEVRMAVQQALTWGNWGSEILVYAFLGALYGEVFVEVQIDPERQKVYPKVVNPRYVCDVACNDSGDVVSYRIDVPQWDRDRQTTYLYGKVVAKETVTTLKDGYPFDYDGLGAERPNWWGFAPAHWVMHRNLGGMHGGSVLDALTPLIDELNGLQSSTDDFIHKFVDQYYIVASDDPTGFKAMIDTIRKAGSTDDAAAARATSELIRLLPGPPGAAAFPLIANLGLGEASVHFDRIMANIDRNWPEVVLSEKLQDMQQVTAPGALPLVQDVQQKLDDACANYDLGTVKMGQMCLAILGEILKRPRLYGWATDATPQLDKFRPFDLRSFDDGEIDFGLTPRDLIPRTMMSLATEAAAVEALTSVWSYRHVGLDDADLFGRKPDGAPNEPPPDTGILGERRQRQQDQQAAQDAAFARLVAGGQG
jgi:hypothetical protein